MFDIYVDLPILVYTGSASIYFELPLRSDLHATEGLHDGSVVLGSCLHPHCQLLINLGICEGFTLIIMRMKT